MQCICLLIYSLQEMRLIEVCQRHFSAEKSLSSSADAKQIALVRCEQEGQVADTAAAHP